MVVKEKLLIMIFAFCREKDVMVERQPSKTIQLLVL